MNTATRCHIKRLTERDVLIPHLGECKIDSTVPIGHFVSEDDGVFVYNRVEDCAGNKADLAFEAAGPREKLYFDPSKTKCAIVTCGGICPGVNNVIRALVMESLHVYRVPQVLGVRYGLEGFIPSYGHEPVRLTHDKVSQIHEFGGTILGSSRGPQPAEAVVDALERMNVSILYMIGGDGTMRAAQTLVTEIKNRNRRISVIGIPKTIDNDISFVTRSFGFDTAVEKAQEAIRCAHIEARGAPNGIGLVKVMGRNAGFIAAQSALALKDVNFVLVPEARFKLQGERGLLKALHRRIAQRGNAVIVVAEGAGQELLEKTRATDASGNVRLGDICGLLKKEIKAYFKQKHMDTVLKYIDPSYIIRSVPANSNDSVYCGFLGQNAVHAAMAGRTGMVVSRWNGRYVHLPLRLVTMEKKKIDTCSNFWRAVLESTGQPVLD